MEVYATALRLSGTVVVALGCISHSLVLALNWRKLLEEDNCGSFLLIEVYSLANILRLFTGWLVIYRTQTIATGETLFFSYGICALAGGPKFCGVSHAISSHFAPFVVLLIPVFMAMRALILFGKKVTRRHIGMLLGVQYLLFIPLLVELLQIALSSSAISDLPEELWSESRVALPYVEMTQLWQSSLFFLSSHLSVVCAPITAILRYIMMRKLDTRLFALSPKTQELHTSFVRLLTFDLACLFLGIGVTILRFLSNQEYMASPLLATVLSAFNFPILCSMPAVQGLATLYYVPYMRKSIAGWCGVWKAGGRVHDTGSE